LCKLQRAFGPSRRELGGRYGWQTGHGHNQPANQCADLYAEHRIASTVSNNDIAITRPLEACE
jgi:hypothetical protein